jgi:IS30 family transposase
VRRKYSKYQGKKIVTNEHLKKFVDEKLYDDQSPRAIAGRLKRREKQLPYVSKDSICRYIKSVYGRKIEAYRNKHKPRRRPRKTHSEPLQNRTFISKRPKIINGRSRVGDTEADFIVSGKTGTGVLLVVVCRKLRVVCIEHIRVVTIHNVHRAFKRIKKRFPEMKTITMDNDVLFQKHKELEELLGVKIYFCDPYSSWQKGSVENVNKGIRKYIPKGSDISQYSKYFIKKIETKLNNRIMECLDYATPYEALEKHRNRKKRFRAW